jgi:HPt (histidine-containing phosphotransfer) domain-containing protein
MPLTRAAEHPVTAEEPYTVILARDFEELVPGFLANRHKELEELRGAVAAGSYEQLSQIGHRMRGIGTSYGFDRVSVLGGQIEGRAAAADRNGLVACVAEYADYLARLKVVYE